MNKNINNHNGKEIHKDQLQKNIKGEGGTKPKDRIKKRNPESEKETQSGEPKKAPNVQRNTIITNQKAPKAQSISLGNKDKKIYPIDSPASNSQSQVANPNQTSSNGTSFAKQATDYNVTTDNSQKYNTVAESHVGASNTSKFLYVFAAILVIAWIIGFFFYELGANIHMLLALAIIVGIISFFQGKKK